MKRTIGSKIFFIILLLCACICIFLFVRNGIKHSDPVLDASTQKVFLDACSKSEKTPTQDVCICIFDTFTNADYEEMRINVESYRQTLDSSSRSSNDISNTDSVLINEFIFPSAFESTLETCLEPHRQTIPKPTTTSVLTTRTTATDAYGRPVIVQSPITPGSVSIITTSTVLSDVTR